MANRRSALVLANHADDDAGFVGQRLRERGYDLRFSLREEPGSLPDPRDHDLVLSLGSAWSAYWENVAEAAARESEALRVAATARIPVLGICYGSHLIAAALGGTVGPADSLEVGWVQVHTRDPALIVTGPWFQWHGDSWTAPPGATVLAHTTVCAQAFALGSVLAVQFHPEVTAPMVERWSESDPQSLARAGIDASTLLEQTRQLAPEARARAFALVDAFLERSASRVPGGTDNRLP